MISDKLVEANLGLVHACCKRFKNRGIEYEELYSAGCLGLVKAVKTLVCLFKTAEDFSAVLLIFLTAVLKVLFQWCHNNDLTELRLFTTFCQTPVLGILGNTLESRIGLSYRRWKLDDTQSIIMGIDKITEHF